MNPPAFSVVMPAFNAERTLEAAAQSVLAQTAGDLELVIVDDGSADGTPAVIERLCARDPRVRSLRQPNRGVAAARNAAIAAARGRLVGFLDSDDLWMPRYVETMAATLAEAPEAGLAYADAWIFEEANGRFRRQSAMSLYENAPAADATTEESLVRLLEANYVLSPTTCRREALESVDGFDESLRGAEDWDLWIRLLAAGWGAVRAPGRLMIGRARPGSLSRDEAMMWGHVCDVLERIVARDDVSPRVREAASVRLDQAREGRARVAAGGPVRAARRVAALGRAARVRARRGRDYLPHPPPEVAAAFPQLF